MIEFRGVSKIYPGSSRSAIEDLSFKVPDGEIFVLVGPSGYGKTTSMHIVNRPIEPSGGEILIDGEPNIRCGATELRRRIGYAIQQIALFPHRTIAGNFATVPRPLGWDKGRIGVDELLELVGLDPEQYQWRYPAELSGDQQQRVGVARDGGRPPIMLMDEPFGVASSQSRV